MENEGEILRIMLICPSHFNIDVEAKNLFHKYSPCMKFYLYFVFISYVSNSCPRDLILNIINRTVHIPKLVFIILLVSLESSTLLS
jgi:hypothetical protein